MNRFFMIACISAGLVSSLMAQTPAETSVETRFQLDLHVPDAALAAMLPQGFTLNAATQGPAKDCNLRALFSDRFTVNGPDGKPIGKGSSRTIFLAAPVKDASGAVGQIVIAGLAEDPADAPGPFGVYLPANTHSFERTLTSKSGPVIETQDWNFAASSGERIQMHLKFEKGSANRGNPQEVKYYSAKTPTFFQLSKQEQTLDILRNATTNPPDRVKEFSFKAGGGSYAKLFDGTEKFLSWDNIMWLGRSVTLP